MGFMEIHFYFILLHYSPVFLDLLLLLFIVILLQKGKSFDELCVILLSPFLFMLNVVIITILSLRDDFTLVV